MRPEFFREVRERVSARDAAERYGATIDRHGRALCPFHNEHRPSMSFKGARFRCWSCGARGDCIDLTAQLLGLTPIQAVTRLNVDFGLGLGIGRPPTAAEREAAARRRDVDEAYRAFEEWREGFIAKLCAAIRTGNAAQHKAPDELTDAEVVALQWREAFERWADELSRGSAEEQTRIYHARKEVERWTRLASGGSMSSAN